MFHFFCKWGSLGFNPLRFIRHTNNSILFFSIYLCFQIFKFFFTLLLFFYFFFQKFSEVLGGESSHVVFSLQGQSGQYHSLFPVFFFFSPFTFRKGLFFILVFGGGPSIFFLLQIMSSCVFVVLTGVFSSFQFLFCPFKWVPVQVYLHWVNLGWSLPPPPQNFF